MKETMTIFMAVLMIAGKVCCAQQTGMHIRCGSTAYCYLPRKRPDTYRHKKTLGRAPVSPDIAGPCPAEPFQLVPTQLGLISAGIDQLRACESPPKRGLLATAVRLPIQDWTHYNQPRVKTTLTE